MMYHDLRTLALLDWLENDLLMVIESLEPASSDASFRRYFRAKTPDGCFIVMDAPPDKENVEPFIRIAGLLAQAELHVPAIFQHNLIDGFLLLEDLGSQCFLDQLNNATANRLYQSAFASLFKLQTNSVLAAANLPRYDDALLERELAIFEQWFINERLDIELPTALWHSVKTQLIASALAQPVTCVHRDYHCRNLMVLDSDAVGIIDFQDAVIGPITYDLVSLLRDCYIAWSEQQIEHWLHDYYQRLRQAQMLQVDLAQFKRWFDLMGMQRHLKALGIFARLQLRDGKSGYLNDIPRTLNYVITVCANTPEFAEFGQFLHDVVLPAQTAQALRDKQL